MAKFLVIAEKPSVAQSLAKNLSAYQRKDGYLEGNSCIVSWCLGHLAEYAPPEIYDEKYAKWQFEDCRSSRKYGKYRYQKIKRSSLMCYAT